MDETHSFGTLHTNNKDFSASEVDNLKGSVNASVRIKATDDELDLPYIFKDAQKQYDTDYLSVNSSVPPSLIVYPFV